MTVTNLPQYATRFIGREAEIEEIVSRLNDPYCRLLTLVGAGGVGKTRLAIEVAQRLEIPDDIYYIPLQPIHAVDDIATTIVDILPLQLHGSESPRLQLVDYLSDKQMLLVIDNFEHLLDGVDLLQDIVSAGSEIKLLVTSREALNLSEEWRYPISGLSIPAAEHDSDLANFEASQLFITHARRIAPHFNPDATRKHIVQICRLVDGIPLAIEMAASWLSALSCEAVADKIKQGQLDTRLRNVPERHTSMAVVFEQSWDLLTENEQNTFCALSVFAGGFGSDAAQYVTGAGSEELVVLVDKSLLQRDVSGRYYIHELTRQFAAEKLQHKPDLLELTLDRHCNYYAAFIHERESAFRTEQSSEVLNELAQEIENIRMMWQHAIAHQKFKQIQEVVRFLAEYYDFRRWYEEGVRLLEKLSQLLNENPATDPVHEHMLGIALAGRGNLLHNLGEMNRAEASLHEALVILRSIEARQDIAHTLGHLNRLLMAIGKFREAEMSFEECIVLARETNDNVTLGYALFNLININTILGKYREAQQVAQEAKMCFQSINHRLGQAMVGVIQGSIKYELGEYETARKLLQNNLNQLETLNSRWHLTISYGYAGEIEDALGNHENADRYLRQSLQIATEIGDPRVLAVAMIRQGNFYCRRKDFENAYDYYQDALPIAIAGSHYLQEAICLLGLGEIASLRGDFVEAHQHFLDGQSVCDQIGWRLGIVRTLAGLGYLNIHENNIAKAQDYLYEALLSGRELGVIPDVLYVLIAIAELLHMRGNIIQAVELLTFTCHHPSCHAVAKTQINTKLNELAEGVSQGAFGFATEHRGAMELDDIIRNHALVLAAGQTQVRAASNRTLVDPLTQRELGVLRLIVEGHTNREIAEQLHISINTVKKHINHMFGKLDVKTRGQAIAKAHQLNLFL